MTVTVKSPISHYRFAKKNDLPTLEYCTLPRTGALEVIFDVLGPTSSASKVNNGYANHSTENDGPKGITKICDVTIAYPDGGKPLDLFQIVFGSRTSCVTHVHYRIFDVKDVSPRIIQENEVRKSFMRLNRLGKFMNCKTWENYKTTELKPIFKVFMY